MGKAWDIAFTKQVRRNNSCYEELVYYYKHIAFYMCKYISAVGNTPATRTKQALLKAHYEKQSILENDVPPLFRDYDERKMKTSWYDRSSKSYKFRTSMMPAYFVSLKNQAMNGIKHRSYKIGIVNGYINGKLADPHNWKKTETLSDGCEVYESTVSLMQEYQSVTLYGSVERKHVATEKDQKDRGCLSGNAHRKIAM